MRETRRIVQTVQKPPKRFTETLRVYCTFSPHTFPASDGAELNARSRPVRKPHTTRIREPAIPSHWTTCIAWKQSIYSQWTAEQCAHVTATEPRHTYKSRMPTPNPGRGDLGIYLFAMKYTGWTVSTAIRNIIRSKSTRWWLDDYAGQRKNVKYEDAHKHYFWKRCNN